MNVQRIALAVIALALLCAEVVQPTHFATKRFSRAVGPGTFGSGLDSNVLDSLPPIDKQALGSIDFLQYSDRGEPPVTIKPSVSIPHDATVIFVGWCGDPEFKSTGAGAFLTVDGRMRIDVSGFLGKARPDVVKYYSSSLLLDSGFRIELPAIAIGSGTHEIQFGVIAKDRRGYFVLGAPLDVTIGL